MPLENWMKSVPARVVDKPMMNLCIPGAQLRLGVRYLDIRLSQPKNVTQPICTVHGLYGMTLSVLLDEIEQFSSIHKQEIIIVDFNHFYNISPEAHKNILSLIEKKFEHALCLAPPQVPIDQLSLGFCWKNNYRLVVFYQSPTPIKLPQWAWFSGHIMNLWADMNANDQLLRYLHSSIVQRSLVCQGAKFYNCQAILTPRWTNIVKSCLGTLKDSLSLPFNERLLVHLKEYETLLRPNLNIISVDFVDCLAFCDYIVQLNYI